MMNKYRALPSYEMKDHEHVHEDEEVSLVVPLLRGEKKASYTSMRPLSVVLFVVETAG